MTAKYFALLTNVGAAKLANATALGVPLKITAMAVGDGNGTEPAPDATQTTLVHECHRAPLNTLSVDEKNPSQIIAEQVLPETVGGWWVREIGLFDDNGDMIAVGNCPPSYKPLMDEGSGREQIIRMILIVSSSDAVELKIDPSVVLATRQYVDDSIETHAKSRNHPDATLKDKGFVQLSSATNSDAENLAATPKAVKAANDNANGRLPSGGTAAAATKLATARKISGVAFDGTADITLTAAGVGALPSGGTAAAATKLATARKIAGVAFDGTADIAITAAGVGALPSGGTAAAATKLATARKIAGVAFDGTADIAITSAGVGALPSGGTAAAATKLATARKIAGHAFDGTADISISAGDVGLGNVGNFIAVQQSGGAGMAANKIYIGWTGSKIKIQVDASDEGEVYTTKNPPPIPASVVTGVRPSAMVSAGKLGDHYYAPDGSYLSGLAHNGSSDTKDLGMFYTTVQICVDGVWKNIA